jgi:hypothetical protein
LTLPVLVDGRVVAVPVHRDAAKISGVDDMVRELATDTSDGRGHIGPGGSGHRSAVPILSQASLDEMRHVAAALDNAPRYLPGGMAEANEPPKAQ